MKQREFLDVKIKLGEWEHNFYLKPNERLVSAGNSAVKAFGGIFVKGTRMYHNGRPINILKSAEENGLKDGDVIDLI